MAGGAAGVRESRLGGLIPSHLFAVGGRKLLQFRQKVLICAVYGYFKEKCVLPPSA
jgi:hypothetical protein